MWNYFREVRAEMRHVSWPSREQTIIYTIVVIAASLVTALYLGALDYVFGIVIRHIV